MLKGEFLDKMAPLVDELHRLTASEANERILAAVTACMDCIGDLMNEAHAELAEAKETIRALSAIIERQETGSSLQ